MDYIYTRPESRAGYPVYNNVLDDSISLNVDRTEASCRGSSLLNIWSGQTFYANMIRKLIWILTIPLVSLDLKHILRETSVPRIQEEYNEETKNLTCKDILHMQHILVENVPIVPRTQEEYNEETKDLKCNHPMLKITYVLNPGSIKSPGSNKTSIGCFCEKSVAVKNCLEYNKNNEGITIIQPKGDAPCHNLSITPCNVKYCSPESYKLFECFEKYGGISSPIENQRNIKFLKTEIRELKKMLEQRKVSSTKQSQELKKELEQAKQSSTKKIQELKKQTIDLQSDLKTYKWIAIVFIIALILSVLFNRFIFFHCRSLETTNMSLTSTGAQTTVFEMKSDDEQNEENRDEDHSKREKRRNASIRSIQYRPDCVQPEDSDDDDYDETQELHVCEELHKNIPIKPKQKTSAVFFDTEAH